MTARLFQRVIATYLLFCLVPIITGVIAYHQAALSAQRKTEQMAGTLLERSMSAMSGVFGAVEAATTLLSIEPDVLAMVRSASVDESSGATFRMYDAREALARNKVVNENLLDLMLYCERSGAVVTASHLFINLDRFYGVFFAYDNLTQGEWQRMMLQDGGYTRYYPAAPLLMRIGAASGDVRRESVIMYTRTVRAGAYVGKLIASVSLDALNQSVGGILDSFGGFIVIRDADGRQLAAIGDVPGGMPAEVDALMASGGAARTVRAAGGDLLLIGTVSDDNGWQFAAALNRDAMFGEINYLTGAVALVVIVEGLVLAVLAFMLARRSVKPVENLIDLVRDVGAPGESDDVFEYIRRTITAMKEKDRAIQGDFKRQKALLHSQLVPRALSGAMDQSTLRRQFEEAALPYPDDGMTLIMLLVEEPDGDGERAIAELTRMALGDFLEREVGPGGCFGRIDVERFAVLLGDGDAAGAAALVGRMLARLRKSGCAEPIIAISPPDGASLRERYLRACARLYRWDARPGAIDYVAGDAVRDAGMRYTVKAEERLIRLIKSGGQAELRQLLDKLRMDNEAAAADGGLSRALARAFKTTMARVQQAVQFSAPDDEEDIVNRAPDEAVRAASALDDFVSWCMRAEAQIERTRQKAGGRSMEPVYRYLDERHADKQLSLAAVAEQFGFSETYFSRLFKAQAGIAYSEYLENLRIERACDLLKQGLPVDVVAD
ncbi:MAG: helix-turn-helix transcriptional regulator, partial [Clostridiales bacterium]|nr:helix-turn-helix transcriptional regulator [Clostridiales bacterium]